MTEKSNFQLDKRIKSIEDIQTIISNNRGSIGCKGFFFDNYVQAKVLTKTHYGTLVDIDGNDDNDLCFKARDKNGIDFVGYFRLFIPEDALKPAEKKYRPYTKDEFLNKFECGKPVNIRHKDDHINVFIETMSSVRIDNFMDEVYVRLYEGIVDLQKLFDEFEWQKSNGEWQPFGFEED